MLLLFLACADLSTADLAISRAELSASGPIACQAPDSSLAWREVPLELPEPVAENVSAQTGWDVSQSGGGLAVVDLDGDGLLDLALPNTVRDQLFMGQPDGSYADETLDRWPDAPRFESSSIVPFDLDGDGDLDLFVCGIDSPQNALFENDGDGYFTDVTAGSGIDLQDRDCYGAGFGDMDGDGDLDLALANNMHCYTEEGPADCPDALLRESAEVLWENLDDGTFRDVSDRLDHDLMIGSLAHVMTWLDIDDDGDQDLYISNDHRWEISIAADNVLLLNDGTGHFVDASDQTATGIDFGSMGLGIADLNGDGVADFAVAGTDDVDLLVSYDGIWVESSQAYGIEIPGEGYEICRHTAWGTDLIDIDNDGHEDLLTVFGGNWAHEGGGDIRIPQCMGQWMGGPNELVDRTDEADLRDEGVHRGVVLTDTDDDGTVELFTRAIDRGTRLYTRPCNDKAWLRVALEGSAGNTFGVGARIQVQADGRLWTRWITASGESYQSTRPYEAHFGLGEVDSIDLLSVTWPGGQVDEFKDVQPRQVVRITHPDAR